MNSVYNIIGPGCVLEEELNPNNLHKSSTNPRQKVKPSLSWRVIHCLLCITGGTTFLLGSIQYLPYFSHEAKGAYLFTIGSFCFFIADLLDFFTHHQFGRRSSHDNININSDNIDSNGSWLVREEDSCNSLVMTTGSLSYFIGCVYFIPKLNHTDIGDILFIPGSILLFIAEVWRIQRSGSTRHNSDSDVVERCTFALHNITDMPALYADLSLCLGAVAFLVGSILFLPAVDITAVDTRRAAMVFILGSALFLQSALCLFYDYFIA